MVNLSTLKNYWTAAKNILLPRLCLYCQEKITQEYLCIRCREKIIFLNPPLCKYCSKPLGPGKNNLCKECAVKSLPFHRVISVTAYKEPLITLIHLFKYGNYDFLAQFLSSLMLRHLLKTGFNVLEYDFVIPVPMHKDKLKTRGYNQAHSLAKSLSNYFQIPLRNDIMENTALKPSQTKLTVHKRQLNTEGIFTANSQAKGKKLLLIDDILTTGSTANACSQALKEKGADIITVITLSKTI